MTKGGGGSKISKNDDVFYERSRTVQFLANQNKTDLHLLRFLWTIHVLFWRKLLRTRAVKRPWREWRKCINVIIHNNIPLQSLSNNRTFAIVVKKVYLYFTYAKCCGITFSQTNAILVRIQLQYFFKYWHFIGDTFMCYDFRFPQKKTLLYNTNICKRCMHIYLHIILELQYRC